MGDQGVSGPDEAGGADARDDPLVAALAQVVGPAHVLTEAATCAAYVTDWTGRWTGPARAVVRPADTGEVAGVLRACAVHGAAVVPQGGNTGLVGGSVPRAGEVVVSLSRLDRLGAVDVAAREVVVGAGVTLAALQAHAATVGLAYGVDLAARDSATVGGTIATDAGGIRVVRYGSTRAQLVALTVVLADGTVIDQVDGPADDRVGDDLVARFVGCEGTLGLVTAARVRLVTPPSERAVALVGAEDVDTAITVQRAVASAFGRLEASELLTETGLDLVVATTGQRAPFTTSPPYAVLLEVADDPVAGHRDPPGGRTTGAPLDDGSAVPAGDRPGLGERLAAVLETVVSDTPGVLDVALGLDASDRASLWQLRESHTDALASRGRVRKLDVVVPLAAIGAFLERLPGVLRAAADADIEVVVFGHLGVGDLHVNLLDVPDDREATVEDAVLTAVVEVGGTPAGEHGVGVQKRRWLTRVRSRADIAAMRALARSLDPEGRLNPGVLLPPEGDLP
ncbi:MAG: FAD-binding oxidoreductase [Nitriliruptoraceae bacterium]